MHSINSTRKKGSRLANEFFRRARLTIWIWAAYLVFAGCALQQHTGRVRSAMAESILNATEEQLKEAQAKITYLGPQDKPIATVVFFSTGHTVSMAQFAHVQESRAPYQNDELPYTTRFEVKPAELRRMLQAVRSVLSRSDGMPLLSFTVMRNAATSIDGHEFRIGRNSAKAFYEQLIGALDPENAAGRQALTKQFQNAVPE